MNSRGITTIEILIVVLILGIIAVMAVINFTSITEGYAVQTAGEQLIQILRNARSEAIARNTWVEFTPNGLSYDINQVDGTYKLVSTITSNIVIGRQPGAVAVTFVNFDANRVIFNNRGAIVNSAGGLTPSIAVSNGSTNRIINIQPATGYIR